MKVLFISHHIKGTDGWSRYARDLVIDFQKNGVEVLCLVHELSSDTSQFAQKVVLGTPLSYIANPHISILTAFKIRKIIAEFSPDIIHVIVEPYATILPFLLNIPSVSNARNKKPKIVITVHSTYAFLPILVSGWRRTVSTILTRKMYTNIDSVICVSEYTKQHLLTHMKAIGELKLVQDKTFILAGGVDVSRIVAGKEETVIQKNNSPKEILFVGALKPRKGLLEAINALNFVQSNYIYRIVGTYKENDPYVNTVKAKIAEYGLEKNVVFEGQVTDEKLQNLYQKADLFLMLSTNNGADFEGYGLVYIEANAHGVPCIGPKDSGVSDAILEAKTGYLVDQYDSKAVGVKIDQILIQNPIKAADCIAWAIANSTDKKAKAMLGLYQKP